MERRGRKRKGMSGGRRRGREGDGGEEM